MKTSSTISKALTAFILVLLTLTSFTMMGEGNQIRTQTGNEATLSNTRDSLPYEGYLRIYVTEPVSRWNNYAHEPYHFGFLGFAINQKLSIAYQGSYDNTVIWNGDVSQDNVLVMAAVFSPDWYQGYAYPPNNPFDAYYVDAAAATTPGGTAYNFENSTITHTVLVEEGTATWCQYCPAMAEALYTVYQSGTYPFYFVALVDDKNAQAADRLRTDYNLGGFPTGFFDGGKSVLVGGDSTPSHYASRIKTCGQQATNDINLSLSVEYIGNGDLQIHVTITNHQPIHAPVNPSTLIGPTQGNVGIKYQFNTTTTDEDGGALFYLFDWGDGTDSGWVGPFSSGTQGYTQHLWTNQGDYQMKVKAKDRANHQTDWTDPVTIHIAAPVFVFQVQSKPFGINGSIKNNGDETFPAVIWTFHATGGILKLINISMNGSVKNFAAGQRIKIEPTKGIFGLGRITITMTATVAEQTTTYEMNGLVIGPMIRLSTK